MTKARSIQRVVRLKYVVGTTIAYEYLRPDRTAARLGVTLAFGTTRRPNLHRWQHNVGHDHTLDRGRSRNL